MLSMVSCGNKDTEKKTETDESVAALESLTPESDELKVWVWSSADDDPIINGFVREYPDLKVDNSVATQGVFGDRTLDIPNLAAALSTGDQPDVFFTYVSAIEAYYTDMFMPIHKYFDIDTEFKIEDIDSQVFETTTFNDQIYFMPFDYTSFLLTWNKKAFEDVGLNPDTPPKTWSEYMDHAQKLVTYNTDGSLKTIGVYQEHFRWDVWYITATGEHFVDSTGLNFNWNTPTFVDIMEYAKDLGNTIGGRDNLGTRWWWYLFGNVALGELSADGLGFLLKDTKFDSGISRVPVPDDSEEEYYSASFVDSFLGVPKNANNPTGAWLFIKYSITDGRVERELKNYEDQAGKFVAQYIIHKPTREKLYSTFEPLISEAEIEFIKERDRLVEECNRAYYKPAENNKITEFFDENYKKMLDSKLAPQDFVLQLQEFSENVTKDFIKRKQDEGWVFEEDKDGIPPSNN